MLIDLRAGTGEIDKHLQDNPAETYPPRTAPELWSGPIITVKSQPLPNMGLNPSLDNMKISLGDYGGCTLSYFTIFRHTRLSQRVLFPMQRFPWIKSKQTHRSLRPSSCGLQNSYWDIHGRPQRTSGQ